MIIFDLDGTLANCEHRRHFITPPAHIYNAMTQENPKYCCVHNGDEWKPDWQAFYEACDQDKPIQPVIDLFNHLWWTCDSEKTSIQIWSGRCESTRKKTEEWMHKYTSVGYAIPKIKMRPIGNTEPDEVLKEHWYDLHNLEHPNKNIQFVFDDRKKVRDMWIRRGIFVFDVSQGKGDF